MGIVLLFGSSVGVFIAAYLWLLFATGLINSGDILPNLDIVLLAIGIVVTLTVIRQERGKLGAGQAIGIAVMVTALATLISRTMLWVSLRVDDTLLFQLARERDTTVQALGLTPMTFTIGSAVTFFLVGGGLSVLLGLVAARRGRRGAR